MASIAITKGFKILNKYINPTQLSRSKVLNTVQCSKCQDFNHGYNGCKNVKHVCPHCSLDHELKNCINKTNLLFATIVGANIGQLQMFVLPNKNIFMSLLPSMIKTKIKSE